jgi:HEAT repeat protein
MAKSFDAELAAIEILSTASPAETVEPLRKALAHKNNFLVAKAAKLAAAHDHSTLIPNLLEAFSRFRSDGTRTDPQCWAKNALAKALCDLEYEEPEIFLAGIRTHQLEATWGGTTDTAGTLRSQSALGLVQCRGLSNGTVLEHILPLFTDKELPVRVNAARAVEACGSAQIGTESASLLLRLRAELGSGEPELLGACYSGVLHLEGPRALDWVAKFLHPLAPDDTSAEAAFAIADTRTEAAFALLHATWKLTRDTDFRGTLLTAIALTRQPAAYEFLLEEMASGSRPAREALESAAPPPEILARLQTIPEQ